jgi:hypothetical protein
VTGGDAVGVLRAKRAELLDKVAALDLAIEALGGEPAAPEPAKRRGLDKQAIPRTAEYVEGKLRSRPDGRVTAKGVAREFRITVAAASQRLRKLASLGKVEKNGAGYKAVAP